MKVGANHPLRILHVATIDEGGGAATVAHGLMRAHRARGCHVSEAVGRKRGRDGDVRILPDDRRAAYRLSGYSSVQAVLRRLAGRYPNSGWGLISRSLRSLTHPWAVGRTARGVEDFDFPGTYDLFDLFDGPADIVHCHNLHGGYFDLGALAWISRRVPTVLTLHDMWLLTGHCAYSLGCERWKTGCGSCPDLKLYPAIRRDATSANWQRKRDIYKTSTLFVATPSQWLMDEVKQSMLGPAVREGCVIPNGVDVSVFRPADRVAVRARMGIAPEAKVVLLPTGSQGSMWKDDRTSRLVVERVAHSAVRPAPIFITLGRDGARPSRDLANVRSVPHQTDARIVAEYYQAADVYLHATKADNFPLAILEALACGTPVVATAIGGIPEQIRSADLAALRADRAESAAGKTGILVAPRDGEQMAEAVVTLLSNDALRGRIGENAACDARGRFDVDLQVDRYLKWYRTAIDDWRSRQP